jgi:hypothetical protein
MRKVFLCGLMLLLPLSAAAQMSAPKEAPAPPKRAPTLTVELDRTAIWVGDTLRYTLRAVHDPNVELVLDNFTKDRLPLTPFTVRDIEMQRGDWTGGKQLAEISLLLTTTETGKTDLTIPPVQIFYFVHESGLAKKESAVETVAAPAIKISLGSTIIPDNLVPRTGKVVSASNLAPAALPLALGFAGFLSLAGYGGLQLWRRMHPDDAARQLTREAREKIVRESLARLRMQLGASSDDPRQWSGTMAAAVRSLMAELFQVPGAALTPEEMETALAQSGVDKPVIAQIKSVLAQCDRLRYGTQASGPAPRGDLLQAVERVMQAPQLLSA